MEESPELAEPVFALSPTVHPREDGRFSVAIEPMAGGPDLANTIDHPARS